VDGIFLHLGSLAYQYLSSYLRTVLLLRLSMKEKYESEDWFKEILQSETISVKDAIKLYITEPLETLFVSKNVLHFFFLCLLGGVWKS